MRRIAVSRPSPAMVVALLALFVALGGSGYAAVTISGSNLENRSVAGKKLKDNTLTGTQIKESKLTTLATTDQVIRAGVANGVGNDANCASGTLAVVTRDGRGNEVDHRFTFEVPTAPLTYGQIRGSGSIRQSSANVTAVTHVPDSGVYCIQFTAAISQAMLESSVAVPHDAS